jgi:hypothetical protein
VHNILKTDAGPILGNFFNSTLANQVNGTTTTPTTMFTLHEREISSYLTNKATYTNLDGLSCAHRPGLLAPEVIQTYRPKRRAVSDVGIQKKEK